MKVFISWSGSRSKYIAEALRNWIPKVLQAVKPWMSDEDISTGTRWAAEVSSELEQTKVGIICLTPENQHNPWVMFEAGALSKTISHAYVCPYLIDLVPSQISGPMAQFQAANANEEGTERILQTLNKALGDLQVPPAEFSEIFDVWWPRLEHQLSSIPKVPAEKVIPRSTDEILEEIVHNTREQLRREEIRLTLIQEREKQMDSFVTMFERAFGAQQTWSENLIRVFNSLKLSLEPQIIQGEPEDPRRARFGQLDTKKHLDILQEMLGKQYGESPSELLTVMKEMQEHSKQQTLKLLGKQEDRSVDEGNEPTR